MFFDVIQYSKKIKIQLTLKSSSGSCLFHRHFPLVLSRSGRSAAASHTNWRAHCARSVEQRSDFPRRHGLRVLAVPCHLAASVRRFLGQRTFRRVVVPAADHHFVRNGTGDLSLDAELCARSLPKGGFWRVYGSG